MVQPTDDRNAALSLEPISGFYADTVYLQEGLTVISNPSIMSDQAFGEVGITYLTSIELYERFGSQFVSEWEDMMMQSKQQPTAQNLEEFLQKLFRYNLRLLFVAVSQNLEGFPVVIVKFGFRM
jgi:hypothetical protein